MWCDDEFLCWLSKGRYRAVKIGSVQLRVSEFCMLDTSSCHSVLDQRKFLTLSLISCLVVIFCFFSMSSSMRLAVNCSTTSWHKIDSRFATDHQPCCLLLQHTIWMLGWVLLTFHVVCTRSTVLMHSYNFIVYNSSLILASLVFYLCHFTAPNRSQKHGNSSVKSSLQWRMFTRRGMLTGTWSQ